MAAMDPADGLSTRNVERYVQEWIMRTRLAFGFLLLIATVAEIGCIVPIYSSSPDVRARQLIYASESYRHIPEIWDRIWGLDTPDLATPYRTHGGIF